MASSARFFVGGNWKCNGSRDAVDKLVADLNAGSVPRDVEVVCAPSTLHLGRVARMLDNSKFALSGQNIGLNGQGAYTGETSADMLTDYGIPWVILGHSERRLVIAAETNEEVGQKCRVAINAGLKVIACIGETLPQREGGDLWAVLGAQMAAIRAEVGSDWDKVVIAYEPVWAIGTGVVASPAQAQEVHAWLRKWLADNCGPQVADTTRIIYGGSVNPGNCRELGAQEDVDGFLVGGASLNGSDFITICNARA